MELSAVRSVAYEARSGNSVSFWAGRRLVNHEEVDESIAEAISWSAFANTSRPQEH
jgi:hypothetical protein